MVTIRGKVLKEKSHKKDGMVMDFALKIKNKLPEGIELYKLVLSETATSFAEWHSKDQ